MKKFCWVFPALLFLAIAAPRAHADTISTFSVSGTCPGCTVSGTLTVNVTTGVVTGINVTVSGLPAFDSVTSYLNTTTYLAVTALNSASDTLEFAFTSTNTPDSFVGLTGGTIITGDVSDSSYRTLYYDLSGTITLQSSVTTGVPEPGTLVLLLFGLVALVLVRKRLARGLQPVS